MTKNPLANALTALVYISLVASVMYYGERLAGPINTIVGPIALISLFTLSAAVMGYVFCYQPLQLYFDNKKKQAVDLFLGTVLIFGVITALLLALMFSGLFATKRVPSNPSRVSPQTN